ncbi:MAG: cache domain-containing protein, partial [Clostridia bacterium]|nr:cache domain-containing protein [Clostridia bacterium]
MFWKRLLFSYLFVILLALSFLGLIVFNQINTTMKDQVIYSNEIILENGSKLFGDFVLEMKNLALDIAIHEKLQEYLLRFKEGKMLFQYNYLNDLVYEDQYLNSELSKNYTGIRIYPVKKENIFYYNAMSGSYLHLGKNGENGHVFDAYEKNGGFIMTSLYKAEGNYIILTCLVYDMNNWKEPLAVLELSISANAVSSLLYNIKLEKNISPYIIDDNGRIFLPYLDIKNIEESIIRDYSEKPVETENEIIIKRNVISTHWKLVGLLPEIEIQNKMSGVIRSFIY